MPDQPTPKDKAFRKAATKLRRNAFIARSDARCFNFAPGIVEALRHFKSSPASTSQLRLPAEVADYLTGADARKDGDR